MTTESRPPEPTWVPLLTQTPEPKKIAERNPISHTTRGKRPTKEMIGAIKILAELSRQDSLNLRATATKADLDRATTRKYLRTLTTLRFVSVHNIEKTNQTIPMYSITLMGKIQLLASDFDYTGMYLSNSELMTLIKSLAAVFPAPANRPQQRFTKKLLNELIRTDPLVENLSKAMVKWIRHTAKSLLDQDLDSVWDSSWYTVISRLSREETHWYLIAVNDALVTADAEERFAVVQRLSFLNFLNSGRLIRLLGEFKLEGLHANIHLYDSKIVRAFEKAREDVRTGEVV